MTDAELLAEINDVIAPGRRVPPELMAAHRPRRGTNEWGDAASGRMLVEVDGQRFEVPSDATPAEIDAISRTHAPAGRPGMAESGVRGALQGASFGFGDEAAAAVESVLPAFLRNDVSREAVGNGATIAERYRNARDHYRRRNAQAQEANPGTYLAGELAGAVAAPGGAARGLGGAITQGAAMGAGYSDADLTRGDVGNLAGDMVTGGAFGAGGHGAGKVLKLALGRLAQRGAQREALATARAGVQAAEDVAAPIQSAAGALGGEVQKGSRQVENLMRLEASMTPQQRALYAQLEQQGIVPNLQHAVAQSTLEALPGQAATIAAKKAELAALQQAAPQAVVARTGELMTPQVGADARSMFKSYGEPWALGLGTYGAARAAGLDNSDATAAGALMGLLSGRTRAGKALRTRIGRPAHQAAIGRAEQKIAEGRAADTLMQILRRGIPSVATDAATDDEDAKAQAELARLLAE